MQHIFTKIENDSEHDFTVVISYVQIYMEMVQDLLDTSKTNLAIRENNNGMYLADVTKRSVSTVEETIAILEEGNAGRSVANTAMNAESSRSHACLIVEIERMDAMTEEMYNSNEQNTKRTKLSGKLVLLDLAGSERLKKTGVKGLQAKEGQTINMSLTALGNVIHALSDPKIKHVPYRDSKLTRLLADSLGGNAKTSLMVAIGPALSNAQETINSLTFAQRAMKVSQSVKQNVQVDYRVLAAKLQAELDAVQESFGKLEAEVDGYRERSVTAEEAREKMAEELATVEARAVRKAEEAARMAIETEARRREAEAAAQDTAKSDDDEEEDKVEVSSAEMNALQRTVDRLTADLADTQGLLDGKLSELTEARGTITTLEQKIDDVEFSVEEEVRTIRRELEAAEDAADDAIADAAEVRDQLEFAERETTERVGDLTEQVHELERALEMVTEEREVAEAAAEETIADLQTELDEVREELETERDRVADLEDDKDEGEAEVDDLKEDVEGLKAALEAAEGRVGEMEEAAREAARRADVMMGGIDDGLDDGSDGSESDSSSEMSDGQSDTKPTPAPTPDVTPVTPTVAQTAPIPDPIALIQGLTGTISDLQTSIGKRDHIISSLKEELRQTTASMTAAHVIAEDQRADLARHAAAVDVLAATVNSAAGLPQVDLTPAAPAPAAVEVRATVDNILDTIEWADGGIDTGRLNPPTLLHPTTHPNPPEAAIDALDDDWEAVLDVIDDLPAALTLPGTHPHVTVLHGLHGAGMAIPVLAGHAACLVDIAQREHMKLCLVGQALDGERAALRQARGEGVELADKLQAGIRSQTEKSREFIDRRRRAQSAKVIQAAWRSLLRWRADTAMHTKASDAMDRWTKAEEGRKALQRAQLGSAMVALRQCFMATDDTMAAVTDFLTCEKSHRATRYAELKKTGQLGGAEDRKLLIPETERHANPLQTSGAGDE